MDTAAAFSNEDQPHYRRVLIVPYHIDPAKGLSFYLQGDCALQGTITEREGSILFTAARVLLEETCHYVPLESSGRGDVIRKMAPFNGLPLYQNPAVNRVLRRCY